MAIPDDFDVSVVRRPSGRVGLPLRVRWSAPRRTYDLADRHDRRMVYKQVMREGADDDELAFI